MGKSITVKTTIDLAATLKMKTASQGFSKCALPPYVSPMAQMCFTPQTAIFPFSLQ
jgi:hypothetical protein